MIREKGEALSPVKINTNVWSNSAVQVRGLFTVCEHLLPVTLCGPGRETARKGWGEEERKGREDGDRRGRWKKSGKREKTTRERRCRTQEDTGK